MKKILSFILSFICFSVLAQTPIASFPTYTANATSDHLLIGLHSGGVGSTRQMTIGNFLNTFSPNINLYGSGGTSVYGSSPTFTISSTSPVGVLTGSLTSGYTPYAIGTYTLANSWIYQDANYSYFKKPLKSSINGTYFDIDNGIGNDDNGAIAIRFSTGDRKLYNSATATVYDWENGFIYDPSGTDVVLDVGGRSLGESVGATWTTTTQATSDSSNAIANTAWVKRQAYGSGGSSGVAKVLGTTNQITASLSTNTVTISIATGYTGQTSITTLGSITTGTLASGTKVSLGSDATGDIYYNGGSGALTRSSGINYNGSGFLSLDSGLYIRTGNTKFKFGVRNAVPSFPVPYFRPTTATKTMAMDLMPNGSPSDYSGNGLCWFDCDDKDTYIDENNLNTSRLGISSTVAYVASMKFGTATAKPFAIVVGSNEATDRVMTFTTNKASVSMDQNIAGYSSFYVNNPNSGTAGSARIYSTSNVGHIGLYSFGSGFTTSNMRIANQSALLCDNSVQGMNIGPEGAYPLALWTNNTKRIILNSTGQFLVNGFTSTSAENVGIAVTNAYSGVSMTMGNSASIGVTSVFNNSVSAVASNIGWNIANTSTVTGSSVGGLFNNGGLTSATINSFYVDGTSADAQISIRKASAIAPITYFKGSTLSMGVGGQVSPTAQVHFAACNGTASTGPAKWTAGTLIPGGESGLVEYVTSKFVIQKDWLGIGGTPTTNMEVIGAANASVGSNVSVTGTTGNAYSTVINTTNSSYLQTNVYGSASAGANFSNNRTGSVFMTFGVGTGGVAGIGTAGAFPLVLGANNTEFMRLTSAGKFGIGTNAPSTWLHIIGTTEQLRFGYDASNYVSNTVSSTGGATYDAVGSGSSFTFSDVIIPSAGIKGTTTNDNATALNVGEYASSLVAVGSAITMTTTVTSNITSISLTAGDWDVEGNVNFTEGAITISQRTAGLTSTSATIPTDGSQAYNGYQTVGTTQINSIALTRKRFSLSGTTTIYLVANADFSGGTCAGFGSITARRVR